MQGSLICICNKSQTHKKGKLVTQYVYRKLLVQPNNRTVEERRGRKLYFRKQKHLHITQQYQNNVTQNLSFVDLCK